MSEPRLRLRGAAVLAVLAAGACSAPRAGADAGADARGDAMAADAVSANGAAPTRRLTSAWLADRLTGADAHAFVVDLVDGQATTVTVDGREVNTRMIVDGPGGRIFVEDPARSVGVMETYVIVARGSGEHRITVQAAMARGRGGAYAVRATVGPASERDRLIDELQVRRYRLMRASSGHRGQVRVTGEPDEPAKTSEALFAASEPALALARRIGDRLREARLLGLQGDVRHWQKRFDDAIRLWGEALQISQAIGDRAGEGTARGQLGLLALFTDEVATALARLREAAALCRAVENHYCLAYTLNDLGTLEMRVAAPAQALATFRESAEIWAALDNPYEQGMALLNTSWVYQLMDDWPRALAALDEGEAAWQPDGGDVPPDLGYRPLTRGHVYLELRRDPATALILFQHALAMARTSGDIPLTVAALSSMSQALVGIGQPARAVAAARASIDTAEQNGHRVDLGRLRFVLGDAQAALGDHGAARASFEQAAAIVRRQDAAIEEARVRTALARAQRALGDRRGALASIGIAIELFESARVRILTDEQRASYLSSARASYDLLVELLLEDGSDRAAERALAVAEQARARTLREMLAAGQVRSPSMATPALTDALARAREEVRIHEAVHEALLQRGPTAAQVAASRRELDRRVQAYQDVEASMRARDPAFAALLTPPALDLASVQGRLRPDDTVLAYGLADGASALWRIGRDRVDVFRLPGRPIIEEQIRRARALVTARADETAGLPAVRRARIDLADAALPHALAALGAMLLGPVREHLGTGRLLIVPDGGIAYVPFAALPGADGEPLVVHHEIAYLPSLSLLPEAPVSTLGRRPRIAIAADPVFRSDDPRVRGLVAALTPPRLDPLLLRGASFARLPWSGSEAAAIAAMAPASTTVATGFSASEARVRGQDFASADILHFATHSVLDADAPALSAIVLSLLDEAGQPRDGFLRLHEIVELRLAASLVVLSGCETGLGRRLSAEGLIGLVRGFLYAGARQVLASRWRVHDQGTAELMTRFYRGLIQEQLTPGAALRAAQLALRAEPRWRAPYYWGAFGLDGFPDR